MEGTERKQQPLGFLRESTDCLRNARRSEQRRLLPDIAFQLVKHFGVNAQLTFDKDRITSGIVCSVVPSTECWMLHRPIIASIPTVPAAFALDYRAIGDEVLQIAALLEFF